MTVQVKLTELVEDLIFRAEASVETASSISKQDRRGVLADAAVDAAYQAFRALRKQQDHYYARDLHKGERSA